MVQHFTIGTKQDYSQIIQALTERASADSRIVALDRGQLGYLFVFCADEEIATDQRRQFRSSGVVSPSLGIVTVDQSSIGVSLECGDDSLPAMIPFVKWALQALAPCRVFDDDSDRELTEEVQKDPDILFN